MQPAPNPNILFLIVAIVAALFLLFAWARNLMIKAAMRKFIMPDFKKNGLTLIGYKSVGLLDYGDFRPKDIETSIPIYTNGSPFIDIYLYIYFKNGKIETKERVTVRIKTVFFIVRRVLYSKTLSEF